MLVILLLDGVPSSPFNAVPIPIEVNDEEDVTTLMQITTMEINVPFDQQELLHNGQPLAAGRSLKSFGILDGDIISVCIR